MTRNRQARRAVRRSSNKQDEPAAHSLGTRPQNAVAQRKTMQLCRQVEQTLCLVLSGECKDELLQSLLVESVTPAPNASQLLVRVRQTAGDEPVPTAEILARLAAVAGQLRFAVATSVTRKRAPRLLFHVF